ncbi:MAG: hypothetical protein OER56_01840 [Hyphomicrobiales bacterium]|nr:hypothetical protein [Hyphomicrobiales bacterium]
MDVIKITEHARALLDAHGDKAEAEAAQKAAAAEQAGQHGEAEQWNMVRKAIHELRSGHVS